MGPEMKIWPGPCVFFVGTCPRDTEIQVEHTSVSSSLVALLRLSELQVIPSPSRTCHLAESW